jgi:hypothetical protein
MTHVICWLILPAAFAFLVFAFRQGMSTDREDHPDHDPMAPGGWWWPGS